MDDILIKSTTTKSMIVDVRVTFATLRRYDMKLNLEKRIFGIRSRQFLRYVVTESGIEVNPAKVKNLARYAPQNVREVQRLNERITTLSKFISKSADHSFPFFKVLRKASKFTWDKMCDQAFLELKQYLMTLPALSNPVTREPL